MIKDKKEMVTAGGYLGLHGSNAKKSSRKNRVPCSLPIQVSL